MYYLLRMGGDEFDIKQMKRINFLKTFRKSHKQNTSIIIFKKSQNESEFPKRQIKLLN